MGRDGSRPGRREARAQDVERHVRVGLRIEQLARRDVGAAGDAAGPGVGHAARAAVLLVGQRVEHTAAVIVEGAEDAGLVGDDLGTWPCREASRRGGAMASVAAAAADGRRR